MEDQISVRRGIRVAVIAIGAVIVLFVLVYLTLPIVFPYVAPGSGTGPSSDSARCITEKEMEALMNAVHSP